MWSPAHGNTTYQSRATTPTIRRSEPSNLPGRPPGRFRQIHTYTASSLQLGRHVVGGGVRHRRCQLTEDHVPLRVPPLLAGGERDHLLGRLLAGVLRHRRDDVHRGRQDVRGRVHLVHEPGVPGADHDRVAGLDLVQVPEAVAVGGAVAGDGEVADLAGRGRVGVVPGALLQVTDGDPLHDDLVPVLAELGDVQHRVAGAEWHVERVGLRLAGVVSGRLVPLLVELALQLV